MPPWHLFHAGATDNRDVRAQTCCELQNAGTHTRTKKSLSVLVFRLRNGREEVNTRTE